MLFAPNNDDFTFAVRTNGNAQLWVGDVTQPLALQLDATTNEMVSKPISLKATQLYDLRLEVTQLLQNGVMLGFLGDDMSAA